MALDLPVFLSVDTLDIVSVPSGQTTPADLLDGGATVAEGMLVGVRALLISNTGSVADSIVIKVHLSATEELYSATFDYDAVGETLSDTLNTPVPFFDTPTISVNPGVGSTTMKVTLYVQAMA